MTVICCEWMASSCAMGLLSIPPPCTVSGPGLAQACILQPLMSSAPPAHEPRRIASTGSGAGVDLAAAVGLCRVSHGSWPTPAATTRRHRQSHPKRTGSGPAADDDAPWIRSHVAAIARGGRCSPIVSGDFLKPVPYHYGPLRAHFCPGLESALRVSSERRPRNIAVQLSYVGVSQGDLKGNDPRQTHIACSEQARL